MCSNLRVKFNLENFSFVNKIKILNISLLSTLLNFCMCVTLRIGQTSPEKKNDSICGDFEGHLLTDVPLISGLSLFCFIKALN